MSDLSGLSDQELMAALRGGPAPASPDMSGMSDQELMAALKGQPQGEMAWSDVAKQAAHNAPHSAVEFGKALAQPFIHPIETGKGLYAIGTGLASKAKGAMGTEQNPEQKAQDEAAANAVGQFFADRYGSIEGFKKAVATDPVGIMADLSAVLTGGGTLAAQGTGIAARAGELARMAGTAVDPITLAAKGVGAGAKLAGNAAALAVGGTTGIGPDALKAAARAGAEGGQTAETFRTNMRGQAPMGQAVEDMQGALGQMAEERNAAYRQGMTGVNADTTPLSYTPINAAVDAARSEMTFQGKHVSDSAINTINKMEAKIAEWQNSVGPAVGKQFAEYTPEGLDRLKVALGDIRQETQQGTQARRSADKIYNAVKDTITAQSPEYAKVMQGYGEASDAMKEATRAFSLGEKSSQDTAIRKAQSVARNNVNANYGQRKTVAEALNAYNPNIMPAIYGQALNTWSPRGLAGHIPTAELLTSIATGNISPLAAIPFSSPRAMGEAAYYGGKAAGAISNVANATKLNPMSLKVLGYPGRIPGLLGQ